MSKEIQFLLYSLPDEEGKVQVVVKDETLWCTQKAMAQLFGVGVPAISKHLGHIFEEGELDRTTTVSKMEIVVNTKASTGADILITLNLTWVYTRNTVQFQPSLMTWFMEMTRHPRFTLVGKLQRRVDAVVVQRLEGASSDTPDIRKIQYLQSLTTLLLSINHTDTIITLVLLGKLGPHLCQCL